METSSAEDPEQPVVPLPNDVDQTVHESLTHEDAKLEPEIAEEKQQEAEVRGVLEVIASTGKFWHDWGKLKTMLSFWLKQVLSEYPEAKMNDEEQNASLSETYAELVKRLDQALHSFQGGPPFTFQRLCEILLAARSIYPNLSKLALALEKNLLVTSTLTICTDPYPQTEQKPDQPEKLREEPNLPSVLVENGVKPMVGDRDGIMAEVEEANIDDDMTIDMETFKDIVASSDANSTPTGNS